MKYSVIGVVVAGVLSTFNTASTAHGIRRSKILSSTVAWKLVAVQIKIRHSTSVFLFREKLTRAKM
jgi:hypothetical protein